MDMMWYRRRGLMTAPHIESVTGSVASFNSDYNKIPVNSLICNIKPIQSGTGDPSPENVRPISGRTGLNVFKCGKNLLDTRTVSSGKGLTITKNADGSIHAAGTPTGTWIDFSSAYNVYIPAGNYTLSLQSEIPCNFVLYSYYEGDTNRTANVITNGQKLKVVSFESNVDRILTGLTALNTSTAYDFTIYPQLEVGSTATDYEPYKGSTYSINWEADAGTVYGGTIDVVSGKLVVDKRYALLSDPDKWNSYGSSTVDFAYTEFFTDRLIVVDSYSNLICSYMQVASGATQTARWIAASSLRFGIKSNDLTLEQIKSDAGDGKISICYSIATPIEIQLTPQEVRTLLGENNIWCDSGDVTVDYWKWGK